jgi:cytochrome c-type biogenesis protein CcmH/NrfF
MEIAVAAIVCVLVAVLPSHKGYNVVLWFFAARFIILIVLALVASIRKESLLADEETRSPSPEELPAAGHETGS